MIEIFIKCLKGINNMNGYFIDGSPVTEEYLNMFKSLKDDVLEAEEIFELDELEEFAMQIRKD